jgi:hypothetical protein
LIKNKIGPIVKEPPTDKTTQNSPDLKKHSLKIRKSEKCPHNRLKGELPLEYLHRKRKVQTF